MERLQESTLLSQLLFRKERLQRTLTEEPLNNQIAHLLKEVDGALERIESNTYGICEECQLSIGAAPRAHHDESRLGAGGNHGGMPCRLENIPGGG